MFTRQCHASETLAIRGPLPLTMNSRTALPGGCMIRGQTGQGRLLTGPTGHATRKSSSENSSES
jgi:hypothetical protein